MSVFSIIWISFLGGLAGAVVVVVILIGWDQLSKRRDCRVTKSYAMAKRRNGGRS